MHNLYVHVCINMCTCICMYRGIYMFMYVYDCMRIYVSVYGSMYISLCMCLHIYIYINVLHTTQFSCMLPKFGCYTKRMPKYFTSLWWVTSLQYFMPRGGIISQINSLWRNVKSLASMMYSLKQPRWSGHINIVEDSRLLKQMLYTLNLQKGQVKQAYGGGVLVV